MVLNVKLEKLRMTLMSRFVLIFWATYQRGNMAPSKTIGISINSMYEDFLIVLYELPQNTVAADIPGTNEPLS